MIDSWFDRAARYLYVYTGTMSASDWKEVVKKLYKDNEKQLGVQGSQSLVMGMVMYYCIEVGSMYTGQQAVSKFKSCSRWPDFSIDDPYWKKEWEVRKVEDENVYNLEKKLFDLGKTIPPEKIEYSSYSRDAYYELRSIITKKHGNEVVEKIDKDLRSFISLYSGFAILNFLKCDKFKDKNEVPNLVTTYFIERSMVKQFGDNIIDMKLAEIDGRI